MIEVYECNLKSKQFEKHFGLLNYPFSAILNATFHERKDEGILFGRVVGSVMMIEGDGTRGLRECRVNGR